MYEYNKMAVIVLGIFDFNIFDDALCTYHNG